MASTQGLYMLKWRIFDAWCETSNVFPFQSSVVDILTFLQELLEIGLSFSTIKTSVSYLCLPCGIEEVPWLSSSGGTFYEGRTA